MTDNTARVMPITATIPQSLPTKPGPRTTNRKIGSTTFIVSSRFSDTGKGDIVSKIARLIQSETANYDKI